MMKKTMAKYNNAFGYLKAYFVFGGFIGGIIALLVAIFIPSALFEAFGSGSGVQLKIMLFVLAIIVELFAFICFAITKRKCPPDTNLKTLFKDMLIVGFGATIFCAFIWGKFVLKLMAKIIFHWDIFGGSGSSSTGTGFASGYSRNPDEAYFVLVSSGDNYAVLRARDGGYDVQVYPHDSNGTVRDNNGTLYYPV